MGSSGSLRLIKGLAKSHMDWSASIIILSDDAYAVTGDEKELLPYNAVVLSLGRVIEQNTPHLNCRAIDVDHQTSPEIAAKELYVQQSCYLTALRHGQRYVEEMDEWDVTPETDNCIREDGVYLITGGNRRYWPGSCSLFQHTGPLPSYPRQQKRLSA